MIDEDACIKRRRVREWKICADKDTCLGKEEEERAEQMITIGGKDASVVECCYS